MSLQFRITVVARLNGGEFKEERRCMHKWLNIQDRYVVYADAKVPSYFLRENAAILISAP